MKVLIRANLPQTTLTVFVLLLITVFASSGNISGNGTPRPGSGDARTLPLASGAGVPGGPGATKGGPSTGVIVGRSVKNDVSRPLRDIQPLPSVASHEDIDGPQNPVLQQPQKGKSSLIDHALQDRMGIFAMPTPIANFAGVPWTNVYPSDSTGDIGPSHYVHWVNKQFEIFTKTGTVVYGPANGNTLWSGFGGACESSNDGDPVVQYDPLAGRWLMSQFAVPGGAQGYFQCIAISLTSDPTSSYYRYAFQMSTTLLNDYPKFGVWPDAYYMSIANFSGTTYMGSSAVAFDRARMLDGQPATYQQFDLGTAYNSVLPSDIDGTTPPPPGAPNVFATIDPVGGSSPGRLHLWKFHVDWQTPAGSTLTGPTDLTTEPFSPTLCTNPRQACVSQPGGAYLEAITDRPMYRLAYRNFGDHESLVLDHTVGGDTQGIRWYELRGVSGSPTIYQQGTYSLSDGINRWMGSIAMDHMGNIALGYSASGVFTYPSIRYTGRLVTDPVNTLPYNEVRAADGDDFQSDSSRWGDYSTLSVDPVDDCTFWYTAQYTKAGLLGKWSTRIVSFRFPSCSRDNTPTPTLSPTATATGTPVTASSYAYLQSAGPLTVTVGSRFTLDLRVNSGTNDVVAAQNYLTFTNSIIQNVDASQPGCVLSTAVTPDLNTFDTVLQNETCNSSAPCDFGRIVAPPASIAFASGTLFNPPAHGTFRVAQLAFCASAVGDASIHWQFSPPAPDTRDSEVIDAHNGIVSSPALYADVVVHVVTNNPTATPTMTPSPTATSSAVLVGHVTWQGRTAGTSANQVPLTLTLKSSATEVNYPPQSTDASGFFTNSVAGLPAGTYSYRIKGTKYLASVGQVTLPGGSTSVSAELGQQRTGDATGDNRVNVSDFTLVKNILGKSCGDAGYDDRPDFNGDCVVNISDFSLLKSNFGQAGPGPLFPANP